MKPVALTVEVRNTHGKEVAKRLRRDGLIPAVLYGHNTQPVSLSVSPDALMKALDNPYKRNTVFAITVNGATYSCMARELQMHPVSRKPLHVDFYSVSDTQVLQFNVPLRLTGRPVGVQKGGQLTQPRRALKLACPITAIPEVLELDIAGLDLNQTLTVVDLPKLEDVRILEREALILASVMTARAEDDAEGAAEGKKE